MKKTFPLTVPGKDDHRILESIKIEVNKYVKREKRKTLPEGFELWDFTCKVGADQAVAVTTLRKDVTRAIDEVAKAGGAQVYVEILAFPAKLARPAGPVDREHAGDAAS